jgi:chromosome segregation ATPase
LAVPSQKVEIAYRCKKLNQWKAARSRCKRDISASSVKLQELKVKKDSLAKQIEEICQVETGITQINQEVQGEIEAVKKEVTDLKLLVQQILPGTNAEDIAVLKEADNIRLTAIKAKTDFLGP